MPKKAITAIAAMCCLFSVSGGSSLWTITTQPQASVRNPIVAEDVLTSGDFVRVTSIQVSGYSRDGFSSEDGASYTGYVRADFSVNAADCLARFGDTLGVNLTLKFAEDVSGENLFSYNRNTRQVITYALSADAETVFLPAENGVTAALTLNVGASDTEFTLEYTFALDETLFESFIYQVFYETENAFLCTAAVSRPEGEPLWMISSQTLFAPAYEETEE